MTEVSHLIDPEWSLRLIRILSWILIFLGAGKLVIGMIGEWFPSAYSRIQSEWVKKFLTGNGNRLLFGLGGLLTVLLGVAGLALGALSAYLFRISGG